MATVALLRHDLFRVSEGWMVDQARAMERYDPVFVGLGVGGEAPEGLRFVVPELPAAAKARYVALGTPAPLAEPLREMGVDLVHAHFGIEGTYGLGLARALDVPLVTTFHGFDATRSRRSFLLSGNPEWTRYALLQGRLQRDGDRFVAVSDFVRERLLERGYPAERTVRRYIGVDPGPEPPGAGGREPGLILTVARLVEKKGVRHLLAALPLLHERVPSARLAVVGDGPLRGILEERARDLGVADAVTFRGRVDDAELADLYRRASVFCLASVTAANGDAEGLGMVLLEAARAGLPLVGTRHGGIPEVVEDGEVGFLVPEADPPALAERLADLLEDEGLRARFGRAARRRVEARFDLATCTRALEDVYDAVLAEAKR